MHGGILVNTRPLHKVLSLGHVWLLFIVCDCWGNAGMVRGAVGQWASDPLPGRNALTFFPGPPAPWDVTRTWAHRGWRTLFPLL